MNHRYSVVAAIVAALLATASPALGQVVELGAAGDFAILAKSGISTTGTTSVVGDVGLSPAAATFITGFGLILDASNTFSTSSLVTGRVFAADYSPPTPVNLTTAVSNMEAAYTDAAGRAADVTELGAGDIGGLTISPGVYRWSSGVTIPTNVTLAGGPSDIWIFQIAGTLGISSGVQVVLSGGARARHVFWQVAGATTLGTNSRFKGIILDQTAIVMNTGATLDGRALAQTAVTLDANTVNSGSVTTHGSNLVDDLYFIASKNDPNDNTCEVGAIGNEFVALGDARGEGTGGEEVRISYNAPQPTNTARNSNRVLVKQNKFATIDISFDGTSATGGPVSIEKCSVDGLVDARRLRGSASLNCKTDSLFALLSPGQVASIQAAFDRNKDVKFKVNRGATKGSISIKCRGDASIN